LISTEEWFIALKNDRYFSELKLNLNDLTSGIYILKVTGEGLSYTEKIILN
jgi:hypothetical protein